MDIQDVIKKLEQYNDECDDIAYVETYDILESMIKQREIDNKITGNAFDKLERKYGRYCDN